MKQTKTTWNELPNANHINLVLASLESSPNDWAAAWMFYCHSNSPTYGDPAASWRVAQDVADVAKRGTAKYATWIAARDATHNAGSYEERDAAYRAARRSILALVAYDDCVHMIDSDTDELRILSKLGSHAATLMIPASIAFKSIREKQNVK